MLFRPIRQFRDTRHTTKAVEQPAAWPVTLQDVKRILDFGETTAEDDAEVERLIPAGVHMVETDVQRALSPRGWAVYLEDFPLDAIELRRPPIISVTSVTYTDSQGGAQTLSSTLYDVDIISEPGRILTAYGEVWPSTMAVPNAVTVAFEAGYATTSLIPPTLIEAVLLAVKALYLGCEPGESYWAKINRNRWEGGI